MRRLGLLCCALLALTVLAVAPSAAGPNCAKNPQAGPCKPKPTPSPTASSTPTVTATPTPSPTPTATPTTPSGVVNPPASITDAVALAAWLQALPAGSVADLQGRTFTAEKGGRVTGQTGLTIRNGRFTRTTSDPATSTNFPNPLLWLYGCTRCTVQGLTFRGNNTTSDLSYAPEYGSYLGQFELDAALRVEEFTDVWISGLDVDGVWGDGVQLQNGTGATLTSSVIDRIGRQGVTIVASQVLVDGVQVLHGRRSGFDLEPDFTASIVAGIEIRNSFTRTQGLPFASAGRGQVNDVWIHGNTSDGDSVPIVYVKASDGSRRHGWRFEDHQALKSLGSPQAVAYFVNVDNVNVHNVTAQLGTAAVYSRIAVDFTGCGGSCEATGNTFTGALYYRNANPQPGQTLTVTGNTPTLTQTP